MGANLAPQGGVGARLRPLATAAPQHGAAGVTLSALPPALGRPAPWAVPGAGVVPPLTSMPLAQRRRWLLRASELESSPSADLGMSAAEEWRQRRGACALIAVMCRDLIGTKREAERVRAIVCTSQLYLQRFFCVQPLQEHTPHIVACACLMLAAKAEEAPLRAVSIVECLADRWPRALGAATAAPSGSAAAAASAVAAAAASGDASGTSSRAPTADPAKPDESRPNRLTVRPAALPGRLSLSQQQLATGCPVAAAGAAAGAAAAGA